MLSVGRSAHFLFDSSVTLIRKCITLGQLPLPVPNKPWCAPTPSCYSLSSTTQSTREPMRIQVTSGKLVRPAREACFAVRVTWIETRKEKVWHTSRTRQPCVWSPEGDRDRVNDTALEQCLCKFVGTVRLEHQTLSGKQPVCNFFTLASEQSNWICQEVWSEETLLTFPILVLNFCLTL